MTHPEAPDASWPWRGPRARRAGWGLVAFGVVGLVLIAAASALVLGTLSSVDAAVTGFERQRTELVAMLGPASDALSRAATSASNASASITETSTAARDAAALTASMAASFEQLAGLGTFSVFGARPFADVAGQFATVGGQSRTLSSDLTAAADAMAANVTDSRAVATDLQRLAEQLDRLEGRLAGPGAPAPLDLSLPLTIARIVLFGLLAWLAVPAVVSIWLGGRLIGRRRIRGG